MTDRFHAEMIRRMMETCYSSLVGRARKREGRRHIMKQIVALELIVLRSAVHSVALYKDQLQWGIVCIKSLIDFSSDSKLEVV